MAEFTEGGKWQARWKNLSICQPKATTHRLEKSGEDLSQFSQWSSTAYELGDGTPSG